MSDDTGSPAWLHENDDGSITIDFGSQGPRFDGVQVETLVMREPTVQDQLTAQRAGKDPAAAEITLIANLVEQSADDIRAMTMRQFRRLQTALAVFLE